MYMHQCGRLNPFFFFFLPSGSGSSVSYLAFWCSVRMLRILSLNFSARVCSTLFHRDEPVPLVERQRNFFDLRDSDWFICRTEFFFPRA